MGDPFHVDVDNLDRLGRDMITMAGFLEGGTPLGTGDATSDDLADRVDTLISSGGALGGAREMPLRSTSDQSLTRAAPASAVRDFVESWEGTRSEISSDIRTVGTLLQQSGNSYRDREEEISFEISSATPAAPAVRRDPVLIGGGEGAGASRHSGAEHPVTQDGPQ